MTNPRIELDAYLNAEKFIKGAKEIQERMDTIALIAAKTGISASALNKSFADQQKTIQKTTMSWTDFRSMYSTVLDVVRVGQAVWEEVGQKYVDNAVKVGDMARSLGATTEEASRLKEAADDVGISVQSLTTSMKMAQKDGFDVSVASLAKMSDEYLKLAPGVERTQYLLDRFGKSGEEMGKLLDKGSTAILANAAAINKNMLVTEKAYQQAREYQISQDALKDAWDALTYQAAPPLVNALTAVMNHYRDISTSLEENGYWYTLIHQLSLDDIEAKRKQSDANLMAAESADVASGAFETEAEVAARLASEMKVAEEAIKETTEANKGLLGVIGDVQSAEETFAEKYQEINSDLTLTDEERIAKINEVKQEYEIAKLEIISGLAERKLMEDGILTDDEVNWLITKREEWGIYSADVADKARSMMAEVNELTSTIANVPTEHTTTFNMVTNGSPPNLDSSGSNNTAAKGTHKNTHASGGDFLIPMSYGNEGFNMGNGDTASGGETVSIGKKGSEKQSQTAGFDYGKLKRAFIEAMAQAG